MKTCKFIFFLVLFASVANAYGQRPKKFIKVGEEFMEYGKYEDAVIQFSNAIDVDPDNEDAHLYRAQSYEKLQDYSNALKDYEKLTIFDEKEDEYFYNTARMYYLLQDYEKSLQFVDKALDNTRIYPQARQLKVNVLIELEKYNDALEVAKNALRYRENDINFYNYGVVNELVGLYDEAEDAYKKAIRKNKSLVKAYVKLADLQRKRKKLTEAFETVNSAINIKDSYTDAYRVRSAIYADQLKYSEAINDISTILLIEPDNSEMYYLRGLYYQDYAQHMNAISDFNKVISMDDQNAEAYFRRAYSYEQIMRFDDAIKDYKRLAEFAEEDKLAEELMLEAEKRLFELNRETDKPELKLLKPREQGNDVVFVSRKENIVPIMGIANDESKITLISVNDMDIPFTKKKEGYEFLTSINTLGLEELIVSATDVYGNSQETKYKIIKTEVEAPEINIIAPYASDNNVIYLDTDESTIYVEGTINDESLIKSIYIDDVVASYVPETMNPNFQAMVNIQNRNKFVVKAEDKYGNISEVTYNLNREAAEFAANNPMGKTWVVFIENSDYQNFASLEGPTKDVTMMKAALAKYTVHNFIHKKNLNKQQLERFFAIELRDLLRSNRVNSILLWYAGHGKFVNETGYWVPVDARRDDEFTYFNINQLKASMQSYPSTLDHTLVITDACESGPSFYQAMRSELKVRSCNDWATLKLKSSQVLSSAGYELAVDNSQFTRTFANILANNPDACLPIESIVQKVTDAVAINNQQKPQFGKIAGLEDEDGTFFFIAK